MSDIAKIHYLPARIEGLRDLALNLWWRWDRDARTLLRVIDPALWSATRHNPVALLKQTEPARLAFLSENEEFLAGYDQVMTSFHAARETGGRWFGEAFPDLGERPVAYFCAEFGLHNSIPIYSGGLGVLAGDHCKSASDLGIPFVGVGLLYSRGYFDQRVNLDGWQENAAVEFDHANMPLERLAGPDGSYRLTTLRCGGRDVSIGAWRLLAGSTRLCLLDTDLEENHPDDRELTYTLYGGGGEYRLKQEWLLGVGGVRILRNLGVDPGAWHANEGHASFMMVERVREAVAAGTPLGEAVAQVRARTIFTTHTPVPAGHDVFSPDLMQAVCGDYHEGLGIDEPSFRAIGAHAGDTSGAFHMTGAAIRLARHVNGVSRLHGDVSQEIWKGMWPGREASHVPIGSVTNGVHLGSWMSHHFMGCLDQAFGPRWESVLQEPDAWDRVEDLSDEDVWRIHGRLKTALLAFCREQARRRWTVLGREASHLVGAGIFLSPEPLTIGFARRFATYKRGDLLFRDEERLRLLLTHSSRPVQLVFAGKAHPADDEGKRVLQRVWHATRDPRFAGRVAFVEDYDLHVAHRLVQGVDVWLNLPRVPKEASGTSGMKAALNGVPQISTVDGWWAEGFAGDNGWALPLVDGSPEEVDAADHRAVFEILEREVVPMYYERDRDGVPREWVRWMKQSIIVAGRFFTTGRMVRDYANRYYAPALRGERDGDDPPIMPEFVAEPVGRPVG